MDIRTFFDALDHKVMYACLVKAGVPRHNINVLIKEYYQKTASLTLGDGRKSSTHRFSLGGWQGGSATPDIANIILGEVLRDTIKSWEDGHIGYHIPTLNNDQQTFTYIEVIMPSGRITCF